MILSAIVSSLLIGACLGALMMFFNDPRGGRLRRALLSAQLRRSVRAVGQAADASVRGAGDLALRKQVRVRLNRLVRQPDAITVRVDEGRVTLRGAILVDEVEPFIAAVQSIPGVRQIRNLLQVHRQATTMPATAPPEPPDARQESWPPTTRALVALIGVSLIVSWVGWQGFASAALGLVGVALLARAWTNMELKRIAGIGPDRAEATAEPVKPGASQLHEAHR